MGGSLVRRSAGSLVAVLSLASLALVGCGDDGPTDPGGPVATTSVTVGDAGGADTFTPRDIRVSPGATVTWTWANQEAHNVTFPSTAIADSGDRSGVGTTFSTTMPSTADTYAYSCTLHAGMNGSVLVQ